MNDNKSLTHTTWNCKYHIVFAPKYRRKIFYGEMRMEIGKILRELCGWKGVTIVEAEVCPDHIHMLVEIPPKMSISSFMGFFKRKKQSHHTRETWKPEIQARQPIFLVPWILRGHGRKKHQKDRRVHKAPTGGRQTPRSANLQRVRRPFQG